MSTTESPARQADHDARAEYERAARARLAKLGLPLTVAAALAATPRKEKVQRGTYMGRRAYTTERFFQSKTLGLRLVVTGWQDDATEGNGGYAAGTVVYRLVIGDGRTPDFAELDRVVEPPVAVAR